MAAKEQHGLLGYFSFFYSYLGNGALVALGTSLLVALLDGFGLAMFLPLLSAAGQGTGAAQGGEFTFLTNAMEAVGLSVTLTTVLSVMLMFFTFKGLARLGMEYYRVVLQEQFITSLRVQNLQLLAGCSYEHFSGAHSGRIQNTLSGEIVSINQAYVNYFQMLQYLIMTVVYAGLAYAANPGFAAIVVLGGLLSNLAFNWINRRTKLASRELTAGTNTFQGFLIEGVSSFKFLKATNLMSRFRDKIHRSILLVEKQQRTIGLMNGIATAVREPLIVLVVVVAILVQVSLFEDTLGILILSLLFFYRALTSVMAVQNCHTQFLSVSGSLENVQRYIGEMQDAQEEMGGVVFESLRQGIVINQLTYAYGERSVLKELSLHLNKFETVAVVGESGSGKTTLVNLICGLLRAPAGAIRVDGVDINALDKGSYRGKIGYVIQESQVFADTIYNNITFWDTPGAEADRRLHRALQLAQAADFVDALPSGVHTIIGINGVNLSGGQRQRLAIARELYRNVDLLILDEATSALDSRSEKMIQENIEGLSGQLTLIVIAHRLSTVRKADNIVHLRSGGGYEVGTFAGLLENSPGFRKMVELQAI